MLSLSIVKNKGKVRRFSESNALTFGIVIVSGKVCRSDDLLRTRSKTTSIHREEETKGGTGGAKNTVISIVANTPKKPVKKFVEIIYVP